MYMLIAFARSAASGNSLTISAIVTEKATAPPIPCTKRAAISRPGLSARPQATEASVNSATPERNTRRRPRRSPRRPATSMKLPNVTR